MFINSVCKLPVALLSSSIEINYFMLRVELGRMLRLLCRSWRPIKFHSQRPIMSFCRRALFNSHGGGGGMVGGGGVIYKKIVRNLAWEA